MVEGKRGGTMMNTMEIKGYRAIIQYDPEIEMFRGEFMGLNGGADFYAKDIDSLRKEGETSLKVFLDMCQEDGVEPRKEYSGKFNLRVPPELHAEIVIKAAAEGKSLNQWVTDTLDQSIHAN
jgi:predicted HicB family RNase H-like nuclease